MCCNMKIIYGLTSHFRLVIVQVILEICKKLESLELKGLTWEGGHSQLMNKDG